MALRHSRIVKIFDSHDPGWFPNPGTHGTRSKCSGHGECDTRNCSETIENDVLLVERGGSDVHYAVCADWLDNEPQAAKHLQEHGYAHHPEDD